VSEHPEYIRGVKDCIARLPNPSTVPGGSKWDTYAACMAALQLLLKENTMTFDHAHTYNLGDITTVHEPTVRKCIAALPVKLYSIVGVAKVPVSTRECRDALESLLPKPDHAKAAVDAYGHDLTPKDAVDCDFTPYARSCITNFARWLEEQGVDLSRWGE